MGFGHHHARARLSFSLTRKNLDFAVAFPRARLILHNMKAKLKTALAVVIPSLFAVAALASDGAAVTSESVIMPAGDVDLKQFVWEKRPIVVFADSANDPAFVQQMDLIAEQLDELIKRDVIILTDTDPETLSPVREKLRPRGFMLAILSKEGQVQLRKPLPWDVREISRSIDKFPIRQREIRDAKRLRLQP